jgi:hypothetical protein
MTRRSFFKSVGLGGAAVPGAIQAASAPPLVAPLILNGQSAIDRAIRCSGVILKGHGSCISGCRVTMPWSHKGALIDIRGTGGLITDSSFTVESAPLWARLLRLK